MSKNHTQLHIKMSCEWNDEEKKNKDDVSFSCLFIWTFGLCDKWYFPILHGRFFFLPWHLQFFFLVYRSWKYLLHFEALVVTNHLPNVNEYIQTWPFFSLYQNKNTSNESKIRKKTSRNKTHSLRIVVVLKRWKIVLFFSFFKNAIV